MYIRVEIYQRSPIMPLTICRTISRELGAPRARANWMCVILSAEAQQGSQSAALLLWIQRGAAFNLCELVKVCLLVTETSLRIYLGGGLNEEKNV